ncbi:hypothetical protein Droror1_Dr00000237 [Drosera rotundifolia]
MRGQRQGGRIQSGKRSRSVGGSQARSGTSAPWILSYQTKAKARSRWSTELELELVRVPNRSRGLITAHRNKTPLLDDTVGKKLLSWLSGRKDDHLFKHQVRWPKM